MTTIRQWGVIAGSGFHLTGLAVLVGGILILGMLTAPVLFATLERAQAGAVMTTVFRRYDAVALIALTLIWLGELSRVCMSGQCPIKAIKQSRLAIVRHFLLAGLTGSLLYSSLVLNPQLETMYRDGVRRELTTDAGRIFDARHQLSEKLYKADWLVAILLLFLFSAVSLPTTTQDSA